VIDEMRPFVFGQGEQFEFNVSFDEHPFMAGALAEMLGRTPDELLERGYGYSDVELRADLKGKENEFFDDMDEQLAAFRPAGWTYTSEELLADAAATGDASETENVRTWAGRIQNIARWASLALVASLLLGIGFLGGRHWWSRVAWAASALLFASTIAFAISGPGYASAARPRIESELAESTADWTEGTKLVLRDRVTERLGAVADDLAGGVATRSLLLMAASTLALGASVAWTVSDRRRNPAAPAGEVVRMDETIEERRAA
jgi:hypothetical protein